MIFTCHLSPSLFEVVFFLVAFLQVKETVPVAFFQKYHVSCNAATTISTVFIAAGRPVPVSISNGGLYRIS
jgi:hypothetical protein